MHLCMDVITQPSVPNNLNSTFTIGMQLSHPVICTPLVPKAKCDM